jgi:hypothetical protein
MILERSFTKIKMSKEIINFEKNMVKWKSSELFPSCWEKFYFQTSELESSHF